MIPKTIHYCWFGGKPLPKSALECIESWHKYMPDYEIKRWDESNFDVNATAYTREAYKNQLYAFVSDYARFLILEQEGGIYLDTDVEMIKPLYDILSNGAYLGIEKDCEINPGLGLACMSHMPFVKKMVDFYNSLSFYKEDESINYNTVVFYTTNLLRESGWNGRDSKFAEFNIYPREYFCPLDYESGKLNITNNTYTIHHYSATWITPQQKLYRRIKNIFGLKFASACSSLYKMFK